MNALRPHVYLSGVTCLIAVVAVPHCNELRAAVTLNDNDILTVDGSPSGGLTVSGDLSVVKGIDFGTTATNPALSAVQLNYTGANGKAAQTDITDPQGTFQWRDNLVATARNKMQLDGSNTLILYKSDGAQVGITLNANTSQINLLGSNGGISVCGVPVISMGSSGSMMYSYRPWNIMTSAPATSSNTGAMVVAGGIGVGMDSYINGIRVGRGAGNNSSNTAYGTSTLQSNTTGYYNTANGYNALYGNTTGYFNTANGYNALSANTTGGSNTAVGSYSLSRNATGYSNTAAGYYALYGNTAGGYNTATGSYALYQNNTGYGNTATGNYSLCSNTTGGYNTAAGSYVLYQNNTGYGNTAVGYSSLQYNISGSTNVAIGFYAGNCQANGSGLSAAYNSIYIGSNSRGFSNLDNNSIVIGSSAVGEGTNTTVIGNNSTTKTHLYGTVNTSGLNVNNALIVDGQTRLRGNVIIERAQGDISMGIYGD